MKGMKDMTELGNKTSVHYWARMLNILLIYAWSLGVWMFLYYFDRLPLVAFAGAVIAMCIYYFIPTRSVSR